MIAVVVPTVPERADIFNKFTKAWEPLFKKHDVRFIKVVDGDEPKVFFEGMYNTSFTPTEVMGKYADCLSNHNAGIRNLGFAFIARGEDTEDIEYIITLDDDVLPVGDPIADHLSALYRTVPTSWLSTMIDDYPRGFPYGIRHESVTVLSHGVWTGVADWDAPNQLVRGNSQANFYKGPIPKGVYYPMCSMNLAFRRCMLPYIFHAPWALGINRFDDIFAGIESKREIDKHGWAAVTGYAQVHHERASNVFTNLKNEAPGIELNETFWQGDESHPYFKIYREKLKLWQTWLSYI